MVIDSAALPDSEIHTDICIIGTGPAGLTVARSLPANRQIWLLEAGPEHKSDESQALYRGRNIGLPYFDLDGCRSRQFGGSGNCWGGFCRLFEDLDFEVRPRIPHSGWPLRPGEMGDYYRQAHTVCQLGPLNYTHDFWAEASGQGPSPFTGANVAPEIRQRSSFDIEQARRELAASSNVHVCLNANVSELISTSDGQAVAAVSFQTPGGRTHLVRARLIVLAAGGIENARLLLASNRVQPQGLGNGHDLVGRFFMDHLDITAGFFEPTAPERFREQLVWKTAGALSIRNSLAIAEPVRRREQLLRCFFHIGPQSVDHLHGYRSLSHVVNQVARGRLVHNLRYHWHNLMWDRRALIAALPWRLHMTRRMPTASGREGMWRLWLTAEPSPNPASRVTLTRDRDRFGVPKVALDWRIRPEDYAHVQRSIELFDHDVRQLGLGRVHATDPSTWPIRGGYHHMGTTRMSDDRTRGVVDRNCRVHGIDNLYIAGSSVFPTAGSGTPTLMIVALALRLADHLTGRGYLEETDYRGSLGRVLSG